MKQLPHRNIETVATTSVFSDDYHSKYTWNKLPHTPFKVKTMIICIDRRKVTKLY